MASREQRETHTRSAVTRTLSPSRLTRPMSPADLDNNLDTLLEDLQASVSRPGSSLGMNGHAPLTGPDNATSYTTREVQYLTSANPTTVPAERDRSPHIPSAFGDSQKLTKSYKTSSYEYSSSAGSTGAPREARMQHNINQLDSLLDDLQQVREGGGRGYDRGSTSVNTTNIASVNDIGIDPGLLEPMSSSTPQQANTKVTRTTRTAYQTAVDGGTVTTGPRGAQRELQFDISPSRQRQLSPSHQRQPSPSRQRQASPQRNETMTYSIDSSYGDIIRGRSPSRTVSPHRQVVSSTRNYNYSATGNSAGYPLVDSTVISDVTDGFPAGAPIPLTQEILPNPSTKVTTTVRTYTYELPGDGTLPPPDNYGFVRKITDPILPSDQTIMYRNETTTRKQPGTVGYLPSPTEQSKIIVYKQETHKTTNTNIHGAPYPTGPSPGTSPTSQTVIHKIDTTNSTHEGPAGIGYPPQTHPSHERYESSQPTSVIYKHDITDTTHNVHGPPAGYPPQKTSPQQPTTVVYKRDVTNTTHNVHGPPAGYPTQGNPVGYSPHSGPGQSPNDPTIISYKYSSHTTNTNNSHGLPEDRQPLLQPAPFPTNSAPNRGTPQGAGNPPKRLDDLMASFSSTEHNMDTYNNGSPYSKPPYAPTTEPLTKPVVAKEVNGQAVSPAKSESLTAAKSKNVTGPPVYYPPGHEMFARKEESSGYMAQGGQMHASGKYKYEAESSSKTKSSSGKAVVPVCLPLCCALPCVIM